MFSILFFFFYIFCNLAFQIYVVLLVIQTGAHGLLFCFVLFLCKYIHQDKITCLASHLLNDLDLDQVCSRIKIKPCQMAKYAEIASEEKKTNHTKVKKQRQPDNEKCDPRCDGPQISTVVSPLGKHCLRLTLHFESSK